MNTRASRFVALAWLALAGIAAQAQEPTQPKIYRLNAHLVNVFVNATDANGAPVAGLTRDDFHLTEDGVPQTIRVFEKQSEQPLNIVLAIDTSGSVRKDWQQETAAATRFLKSLVRPVDKVALMEFSTHVRPVVPFTSDVKAIETGLKDLRPGFATAMYQAVEMASKQLQGMEGRKIIVVISDGGNTAHGTSYDEAFRAAVQAEASVYSLIDVPVEASAGRELGGEHALITMSEDSGGKFYYGGDPAKLEASFRQLSEDLRTQYLLGYYPAARLGADSYRRIGITVAPQKNGARVNLRYRPGYYGPQTASD